MRTNGGDDVEILLAGQRIGQVRSIDGETERCLCPLRLAAEIADDLEAALAQFTKIAARLAKVGRSDDVGSEAPDVRK